MIGGNSIPLPINQSWNWLGILSGFKRSLNQNRSNDANMFEFLGIPTDSSCAVREVREVFQTAKKLSSRKVRKTSVSMMRWCPTYQLPGLVFTSEQFALENGPFTVDFPIKDGDFPVRCVCLPGRVTPRTNQPWLEGWAFGHWSYWSQPRGSYTPETML